MLAVLWFRGGLIPRTKVCIHHVVNTLYNLLHSGYHGHGFQYRSMFKGNYTNSHNQGDAPVQVNSDISQTIMIQPGSGIPYSDNFTSTVERGFQDIVLSLISDEHFHSVVNTSAPL